MRAQIKTDTEYCNGYPIVSTFDINNSNRRVIMVTRGNSSPHPYVTAIQQRGADGCWYDSWHWGRYFANRLAAHSDFYRRCLDYVDAG